MKKVLFLFITLTIAIASIVSCNSSEVVIDDPSQTSQDFELAKLYNSIDSLQNEYLTSNITRVDLEKWGRRGFFFAVDGVVGLLFAETGPFAGAIAAVGSGLYEDYFDYMVDQCNKDVNIQKSRSIGQSSIQAVVFPVDTPTYVDSIGYYHNLIINTVYSNGKTYTSEDGNIKYMDYYKDILAVAKNYGIQADSHIDVQLLFDYLESIIKPMAQLEINCSEDVSQDILLPMFFNNTYGNFNFNNAIMIQHQEIFKKIIYNYANISGSRLVEYGRELNVLIVNSNLDSGTKDILKIVNNIAINSSLRWYKG